jgi:2-polyprenyl-6-methoxyphenol hydroxylase-like FAD-dependent oxidoreductase
LSLRAVVIGGSIGGLLCARVLAEYFDDVFVLDRDEPPEKAESRKGVPQDRHVHCLLAAGSDALAALFPGIFETLQAQGARPTDMANDVAWFNAGSWRLQYPSGIGIYVQSRPLLELEIRRRVMQVANIRQRFGVSVTGLDFDSSQTRITGVRASENGGAETAIAADFVVDCTGRGTRTPGWLEAAGYPAPQVSKVTVDVGYATQLYRAKPGQSWPWHTLLIQGRPPKGTRYGAIFRIEGDILQATLVGQFRDYPPNDTDGFLRFAESLDHRALAEALHGAEPMTPVFAFRFPANSRRHYEKLSRFPANYLVFGDAICSVNPLYGQGMTVAALEAMALRDIMKSEGGIGADLSRRFFKRAAKVAKTAWALAAGSDLAYPQAEGTRPRGQNALLWYVGHVVALCSYDPAVLEHWIRVTNMQRPLEYLFSPRVALKVLRRALSGGSALPVERPMRQLA